MLVLVTVVVGARFWIRLGLLKARLGVDDWCILVAWVLAVAFDLDPINRECAEIRPFKLSYIVYHTRALLRAIYGSICRYNC